MHARFRPNFVDIADIIILRFFAGLIGALLALTAGAGSRLGRVTVRRGSHRGRAGDVMAVTTTLKSFVVSGHSRFVCRKSTIM
jgi:hypothetical protein